MDIDLIMRITAMLDEEKTYKIMKRQLADVQKKLQGQSQISVGVKVNDKAAKQQTHKLWGSLKEKIEKKPVSIKINYGELGKAITQIDNLLGKSLDKYSNGISGSLNHSDIFAANKLTSVSANRSTDSNQKKTPVVVPKMNEQTFDADDWIKKLKQVDEEVKNNSITWQEFYDKQKESGNGWIAQYGQDTQGKIRNEENMVAAYKKSREASIEYNKTLGQMSLGAKAGELALKGLAAAGNMLASWAITAVIQLIVTAFDNFIHRVEIAKETLNNSKSNFDSIKSEFNDLTTELENNAERIKELEGLPKLSFVEQEELERLRESSKELERQKAIKDIELKRSSEEMSKANMDAFKKEFGDDNFSNSDVLDLESKYGDLTITPTSDLYLAEEGIEGLSAAIIKVQEAKVEAENTGNTDWLASLNEREQSYKEQLEDNLPALQSYRDNLNDLMDYRELTEDEQAFYDNLEQGMKLIYQYTDPEAWNRIEFDNIFNNADLDETKAELLELAKSGELTPETLEGYSELTDAIEGSQLIGESATKALVEQLYALAEAEKNMPSDEEPVSEISNTIDQLNSQLTPAFDSIGKAYQNIFSIDENGEEIFSLDNIDLDAFTSIKDGMEEIQKAGGSIDISAYENLISVLSDSTSTADEVHDAFNEMASSVSSNLGDITTANYSVIASSMESMGVTNSQIVAFESLLNNTDALSDAGFNLAKATDSEMEAFVNEHVSAEYAGQALALLQLKKLYCNNVTLNTEDDINHVLALATAAGVSSDILSEFASAKNFYEDALASGNAGRIDAAISQLDSVNKKLKDALSGNSVEADFGNNLLPFNNESTKQSNKSSSSQAGEEAADAYVTAFDEKYNQLKDLRDRDILNEKQYLDALRALNEKYYKNNEKYTDQYEKYKKEYLDGMLSLHDSVISIATKQIDKYISSLEEQKGAAVDSLKEQQDAAKEALEAQKDALEEQIKLIDKQIDAKQAEIDTINEENEAHENTINLEKEQYELERLRNQRTEFTYSGKEKGFVYRTDTGAIRDQEQNVKEAEDKIRIAGIEKEISLLEKQKDTLKDQQDAIDEQIDKVDEYYGKIIEDTETYWDGMIQGAENAKSEWEKMGDAIEEAEDKVKLASVGIDPNDPSTLLSEETIRNFKEMHDSLMADVYAGNSEMLNALSELENVNLSSLTGYLTDTQEYMEILAEGVDFENLNNSLGSVMDQFSKVAEAAGIMTGSVVGTTGVSVGKNNGTNASPSQGSGNGNISFIDAVAGLEKESVPMLNNVADAFAGGEDSEDSTQSIAGSVEAAKAAIAGSSSGKKSSAEGENSSGEDSGSLMEAMAAQSQAALDEETGIPAQIQKWQELNGVLSGILENLRNIAAIIPLLNPQDGNFSVTSGTTGITQANGGLSHGDKNVMVSEYGQLETIIRRNGTYQITSSPTLTDLKPGDIVLNNSKTLALIRSKRRAASSGVKNLSLASPVLFSSALPELQPRNSVLAQSNAAAASPIFADNHQDNKIDVTIGDIILENVRDTDTLSRQIVMRLPTQIKQELSKRG